MLRPPFVLALSGALRYELHGLNVLVVKVSVSSVDATLPHAYFKAVPQGCA